MNKTSKCAHCSIPTKAKLFDLDMNQEPLQNHLTLLWGPLIIRNRLPFSLTMAAPISLRTAFLNLLNFLNQTTSCLVRLVRSLLFLIVICLMWRLSAHNMIQLTSSSCILSRAGARVATSILWNVAAVLIMFLPQVTYFIFFFYSSVYFSRPLTFYFIFEESGLTRSTVLLIQLPLFPAQPMLRLF